MLYRYLRLELGGNWNFLHSFFFFFSQMFAAKLSDKQKYIILSKICSRLNHCWIGAFLTEILKTFYLNQVAAA